MNASPTSIFLRAVRDVLRDSLRVIADLFKIMIPIIMLVKLLTELGLIRFLAAPLSPVMELAGLPGTMGLVWATALLNNIYSAIIVYASLADASPLTAAQVTTLSVMILVAHNLPVELKIARKAGARSRFQFALRLGGALLLGVLLNAFYSSTGLLQEPSSLFWRPEAPDPTLLSWARGQLISLGMIALIIVGLISMMRVLNALKITDVIGRLLHPLLRLVGVGPSAATITVIGLTMGVAYGGGLIIHEARSGKLPPKDVLFSISLMGLCHSLIEDTLIMALIGAHLSGTLWARLVFSLAMIALMAKVVSALSAGFFDRWLYAAEA